MVINSEEALVREPLSSLSIVSLYPHLLSSTPTLTPLCHLLSLILLHFFSRLCLPLFFTPLKVALFYGHQLLSHVLTLSSVHYIYQFFHPAHLFYPESKATNLSETLVII